MSITTIVCLCVIIVGFVIGTIGICFYSVGILASFLYIGLVLFIGGIIALLIVHLVKKETKCDIKYDDNAEVICPHCGAKNDNKTPYCTKCGCRLK